MKKTIKKSLLLFIATFSFFTISLNIHCTSGSIGNHHLKKMYIFVKNETPFKLLIESAFKGGFYRPLIWTPLTGKETDNWVLKMTGWGVNKYIEPSSSDYIKISEMNVHEKKTLYKDLINQVPVGTGKYNADDAKTLIQFAIPKKYGEEYQQYKIGIKTILNPKQEPLINRVTNEKVTPPEIPVRKRPFGLGNRIYANVQPSFAAIIFLIKDGQVVEEKIFTEKSKATFDLEKHGGPFSKITVERIFPRNKNDFKKRLLYLDGYDSLFINIQSNKNSKPKENSNFKNIIGENNENK